MASSVTRAICCHMPAHPGCCSKCLQYALGCAFKCPLDLPAMDQLQCCKINAADNAAATRTFQQVIVQLASCCCAVRVCCLFHNSIQIL